MRPLLFPALLFTLCAPSLSAQESLQGPPPSDPTLARLLSLAEAHSPALERASAALEAGEARADLARVPYRPNFGVREVWTSTDNPPMAFMSALNQGSLTPDSFGSLGDPPDTEDWATVLYGRYRLYDFGRRKAGVGAAREDRSRLELTLEATRRDVRFDVAAGYYGLLRARSAIGLWEETVRLFQAHHDLTRHQFEAGTVLRSDLLAIGVQLSEARENLVSARYRAEIALAALARVVGVPAAELEVPDRPLGTPRYSLEEPPLILAARQDHPSVAAVEAAIRASEQARRAAIRGSWPSLDMELQAIWHGEDETFGFEEDSYAAMIVLEVPLYDGGRARAAAREAAARTREAEAALREVSDTLELALRTAHREALDAVTRVAIADEAVAAAEAGLGIIEERYRRGLARVVDLIEAERQLTASRVRALDARAMAWTAVAQVERMAGVRVIP